jgi:hypothetical protein
MAAPGAAPFGAVPASPANVQSAEEPAPAQNPVVSAGNGATESQPPIAGVQAPAPASGGGGAGAAATAAGQSSELGGNSMAAAGSAGSAAALTNEMAEPDNCNLPPTVSFKNDVRPFLISACGGGNGCHVVDAASTLGSGGYDHAYDWATAGAHTSSCPEGPLRFEVLIDVIEAARPPTCSRSRIMPPPDATGSGHRDPLTVCQVAALQAWLAEPKVTQLHRPDDSSPTTPYAMPPYN